MIFFGQQTDGRNRQSSNDDQPSHARSLARGVSALPLQPQQVSLNPSDADAQNVVDEINDDGSQRAQLHHRHKRRDLLRRHVVFQSHELFGNDQMTAAADGNEFGEALNNAKNDCLEEVH